MKTSISKNSSIFVLGAALLVMVGCASTEQNTRLTALQNRYDFAFSDKDISERGQGDLASAKTRIDTAGTEWKEGDKAKADHNLTLAGTYLDLAETRGQQAKLEKENAELSTRASLIAKDSVIASKNNQLATKEQQLAQAQAALAESNMKITELGSTMVLQDVSFETGKSQLLPGGVNRLTPLINYLRLSPQTQVRIEGYTDSAGGAAFNQQLSLDRANSVKSILVSGGIAPERIATVGSGLNKPVATNSTAAGRQQNRRVEVTLLKQPA
jgi:outer membrane protein OmpA-like peptidoglycan-associated protein